ncbi:MAG: diacylglycerol/lipid kinase family protein [Ornithinimicrobium sp.]|uniref:diacylglycerol/lipid kinase family protein n=1 Tax=Ornithinimicrobium sp. TaxID=1977084 RepID=UPI003D9ADA7C
MRYAVLHGPRSGRGGAAAVGRRVMAALSATSAEVSGLSASSAEAARGVAGEAVADGADVLVVVGGDGLVALAADACAGTPTALGIVPAGSGNDTARSLDIPMKAQDAVGTLLTGQRRRIDLIAADPPGRLVVGSVPAALDARIADRSSRMSSALGPARYAAATLAEVPRLGAQPYRLDVDGALWETEALVVAVCNLPVFGGGMRIAPDADPRDGLLDLVVITPVGPTQALRLLAAVFRGRHTRHPAVHVRRGSVMRIEGPDLTAFGDGEPLAPLPLTCRVRPAALEVLVPRR